MIDKKTRLNAALRSTILENALRTAGVVAEEKQLIEDRAAFAEKCRQYALTKAGMTDAALAKIAESIKHNPFFSVHHKASREILVNLCGMSDYLYLNGASESREQTHINTKYPSEGGPRVPYTRVDIAEQGYADEFSALEQRKTAVDVKRQEVTATVSAVLKSVTTVGKLLSVWPEAAELLPESIAPTTGTGLAINPASLNALCGLPAGDAK